MKTPFEISDEHLEFANLSTGAFQSLLENLPPHRVERLTECIAKISAAAALANGASPTANEVAALSQVRTYVLADEDFLDVEACVEEAFTRSAKLAHHIATKADRGLSEHDIAMRDLPTSQDRLNYARRHGLDGAK